jgi:hypothetical protein
MVTQVVSWWTQDEAVPLETLVDAMTTLVLCGLVPPTTRSEGQQ